MAPFAVQAGDAPQERRLVTPEGVPIRLRLASVSDRITAFVIDACIIIGAFLAITILAITVPGLAAGSWSAVLDALAFLLINGYFIWFELRWSGRTPGKKAVGIRVLSRSGGPLRADAVIVRNLTRNVEIALPLGMILFRDAVLPGASDAAWILGLVWMWVLAFVPLLNRDRLRVGDLVAGTWVAQTPRAALLRDLARRASAAPVSAAAPAPAAPAHAFTTAQLDVYGIFELQALEDVLRARTPDAHVLRATVAQKITRKIGYQPGPAFDADRFLADFYAALRAHHERRMLFGKRKEKKDR